MKFIELAKKFNIDSVGYIVSGEDSYFLKEAISLITKKVSVDNLDIDKVGDWQSFFAAVQTMPFISNKRLVIYQYADFDSKPSIAMLKKYIKNPNPSTIFVLSSMKFQKSDYGVESVSCVKENESVLVKWIVGKTKQGGKIISEKNAKILAERVMFDMAKISTEVEKLVLYVDQDEILLDDIEKVCQKEIENEIFKLIDAITIKNGKKARDLLDNMKNDLTIFQMQSMLFKTFQRMFFLRTSKSTRSQLSEKLQVKEYALMMLEKKAEKFSKLKLKESVEYLESVDFKIKSGQISQRCIMEDMVQFLMK